MAAAIPAFAVAAALLMAADSPGGPPGPGEAPRASAAEAFSVAAGQILGAASACGHIAPDRVSAAAHKAADIASAAARDENDAASSKRLMITGAAQGKTAVEQGGTDCSVVEASLGELERLEQDVTEAPDQ